MYSWGFDASQVTTLNCYASVSGTTNEPLECKLIVIVMLVLALNFTSDVIKITKINHCRLLTVTWGGRNHFLRHQDQRQRAMSMTLPIKNELITVCLAPMDYCNNAMSADRCVKNETIWLSVISEHHHLHHRATKSDITPTAFTNRCQLLKYTEDATKYIRLDLGALEWNAITICIDTDIFVFHHSENKHLVHMEIRWRNRMKKRRKKVNMKNAIKCMAMNICIVCDV